MIFVARVFNADPHPGNICLVGVEQEQSIENKGDTENVKNTGKATKVVKVNKGVWRNSWNIGNSGNKHRRVTRNAEVGILDWGSVKHVSDDLALRFSDMVIALNSGCRDDVIEAFTRLGVQVEKPEQERMVEAIAITMLDTRVVPGRSMSTSKSRSKSRSKSKSRSRSKSKSKSKSKSRSKYV